MNTLENLVVACVLRQGEWDPKRLLSPLFFATELAGEIGEACNVVKKIEREKLGLSGSRATIPQLAEELADGIIVLTLLANAYGIDLPSAVVSKFNKSSEKLGLSITIEG